MFPNALEWSLSFVLGIAANLATDWLKARAVGTRPRLDPPIVRAGMLMWSLPPTLIPITVMYLTKYRWVTTSDWMAAFIVGAFLGAVGLLWVAQRLASYFRQREIIAWVLWMTALVTPFVILDSTLPRHVALWCPTSLVRSTVEISGRTLSTDAVAVHYGLAGDPRSYNHPPMTPDHDGHFGARLRLTGDSGERWRIWATTPNGRTRECTVALE